LILYLVECVQEGTRRNNLATFNFRQKKIKGQQNHPAWMNIPVLLFHNFMKSCESQAYCFPINYHIFSRTDLRKGNESLLFGKFPFSESLSTKHKLWARTVDYGLTQLSVYSDHKKEAYLACKIRSNRSNRPTHVVSNSNPLEITRFHSGISISFKEAHNSF